MTENQTKEVFNLLTKCVNGIQGIREDVSILKQDVFILKQDVSVLKQDMTEAKQDISEMKLDISELKEGQKRIEKEVRMNTVAINEIASEQFRLKIRVNELEKATV